MPLLLMLNNYFHDVATALLLTSALVVRWLARAAENRGALEINRFFVEVYPKLTLLAKSALIWIALGGTVRLLNFRGFEWAEAVGKNQVPVLVLKHIVLFGVVGAGTYFWWGLSRRVRQLKAGLPSSQNLES